MLPKKSIENVLHITPVVSDRMADAIQLWANMYEGCSPWLKSPTFEDPTRIVSLGLPALIASEKARMVTLEMKSEINAPMMEIPQIPQTFPMQPNPNLPLIDDTAQNTQEPDNFGNQPTAPQPTTVNKSVITPSANIGLSTIPKESMPIGPTERAEFLNKQYKKLLKQIRRQLEYGIAKGGLVIKPYPVIYEKTQNTDVSTNEQSNNTTDTQNALKTQNNTQNSKNSRLVYNNNLDSAEIEFDFIQADRFFPLAFDANGKVIEAAFIQTKVDKSAECVYIRLEYHKLERQKVTVQNMAFKSTDMNFANSNNIRGASNLGTQIPLTSVPEWANLQPTTVIEGVDRLLFAYFRMPEANTIDPYSPLGVSGYSRVVQLIKDADMQYSRLLWEFEGGELAIDVDRDALKFVTEENHTVLPQVQQRLFRKVDLNAEDTYNVFAPALRDVSLVHGLNTIFMRIEDSCGLSRGTLSDVNSVEAKTATELKILKQRSFATNADIQMALQDALDDTIYVMDVYCTLYDITPVGEYEVSYEWDDSIIIDSESELSKRITLMQNGLASKLETRMWYFGETENQAKAALQIIQEEAQQAVQQNILAEQQMSNNSEDTPDQKDTEEEEQNNKDITKSPADTTSDKKSSGKQADSLDNPNKSKTIDKIKQNA
ncbi:MAG: hypothetical protein HUJ63_09025 [Enterococcus sp.]|nr:hypothetical protein [Enterococcus sp.]